MSQPARPLALQIDIVSDVVCPWCVIGYLQLRRALDALSTEVAPQLRWHPFELNPQMPPEGEDLREHIARKYGSGATQSASLRQRLTELGAELGFRFDYFDGMRIVNTFRAHQLLQWAGETGGQTELQLALFEAFFSRREDVGDTATLVTVAARAGLDADAARGSLESGRYAADVRESERYWLEREVHAVPAFFLQDQYMIPGAQDSLTFRRVLEKILARNPATA